MDRIKHIKQSTFDGVLFIQGVFKKDCKRMEDMFQDKLILESTTRQEAKVYDKIPVIFTNLDDWPKTTNLKCWRCSRTHKNRPWFEARSIEPISEMSDGRVLTYGELQKSVNKKKISIGVHGVFCTCNCARAYIDKHTTDYAERLNKRAMLLYLYEIFTGKSIPDIQPSPEPTEMIEYGGDLTATEYGQKIDSLDTAYIRELEDNNFASICNIYIKTLNT